MMRRYSNAVLQIGAEIDATIAAVWAIVSPDGTPANAVTHNGEIVTHNGETVTHGES